MIRIRDEIGSPVKEPDSLYYIVGGEAIVYNKNGGGIIMKLNRGQIFGESYLTKIVSHQYVGEIRCGIRPLSLMRFSYEDLDRILTFPEKACFDSTKIDLGVS